MSKKNVLENRNLKENSGFEKPSIDNFRIKTNCKFKNKKQKELFNTILENRITFVRSVAGTGKTIIALLSALAIIKNPKFSINQIVLTKPIVEISSNKGLGALPGTIKEKTDAYFSHFYDNLEKILDKESIRFLKENNYIKEVVLNFIRGTTLGRYDENGNPVGAICIIDECQNTTVNEMKTFISRIGERTKLVIIGDIDQIDLKLKVGEKCGLEDAIDRLYGIDSIALVEFTEEDIVRDPFLIEIMKRYKL